MVATADHVELTATHLVMGLQIGWHNRTDNPIPIKEIQMRVAMRGRSEEPLRFYPLERFVRIPTQRALQKTPVRPFVLPSHETYTEQIRFISQEVLDIPPGNYTVEVQITDTSDTRYSSQTKIQVPSKIKYRRSEEWQDN
jgi:hypothetical protein